MPAHIVFGHVTVENRKSGRVVSRDENDEELGFVEFAGEPAVVGVSVGFTKNLENYESKRIDVSLRVPCTPASIDAAHAFANEWCWRKLKESANPPPAKRDDEVAL